MPYQPLMPPNGCNVTNGSDIRNYSITIEALQAMRTTMSSEHTPYTPKKEAIHRVKKINLSSLSIWQRISEYIKS